jgi:putative FmdB family regulatory protein
MECALPIYEYECVECKHRFERYQSFSEPPVAACPDCGHAVRKVLQPVGIVFKGSGWYKNDSRSTPAADKGDTAKEAVTGASADGKAAGDAKSDSPAKADSFGTSAGGTADTGKKAESGSKADGGAKPAAAAAGSKPT